MIEFEINTIDSPNGGWKIKHPVTGVEFKSYDYPTIRKAYTEHSLANSVMLSPVWEEEFLSEMCKQNPHWGKACIRTSMKNIQRRKLTLQATLSFLNMMKEWALKTMSGKPAFVSQKEADWRADMCASCPMNGTLQFGCGACMSAVLSIIHSIVGNRKTSRDGELGVCLVCSCSLKAAVHIPVDVQQKGLPEELKQDFRRMDYCWKNHGL
jgi:hypothetical protein